MNAVIQSYEQTELGTDERRDPVSLHEHAELGTHERRDPVSLHEHTELGTDERRACVRGINVHPDAFLVAYHNKTLYHPTEITTVLLPLLLLLPHCCQS